MVKTNEKLINEVYEELCRRKPEGFNYTTYKLDDGLTFIHVALNESDGESPLVTLPAFKKFQEGIKERCEQLPVVSHVEKIGSYSASEKKIV